MRSDYESVTSVPPEPPPEERIAKMLKDDLGVTVNAQALRMFIRTRWARLSKAAHEVHDA
jgi:hypothetical protein